MPFAADALHRDAMQITIPTRRQKLHQRVEIRETSHARQSMLLTFASQSLELRRILSPPLAPETSVFDGNRQETRRLQDKSRMRAAAAHPLPSCSVSRNL